MNQPLTPGSAQVDEKPRRKPRKLAQALVTELTRRIADGELKPGDKLPTESKIMEQYGVSRTVVREALQRLQVAGSVETRHGVGTFVLSRSADVGPLLRVSVDSLQDTVAILEFRLSLEVEAAGLAAERRTPEQMEGIREALEALQHYELEGNAEAAGVEDSRFHIRIAEATGNRYYIDVMNHVRSSLGPLVSSQRVEPVRLNYEHEEVCAAIERQDPVSARAAMRLHLSNSRERLLRLVAKDQS